MSLDHLWAGWRASYVSSVADGPSPAAPREGDAAGTPAEDPGHCVFCAIIASPASDRERQVVHSGERAVVMLNAYPYASGHLLVMPRRHLADLSALSGEESTDLWAATQAAVAAVEAAYQPDGMNIGANLGRAAGAGLPRHLHLHVLPRWLGDTNFMTTVASTRVLPEALDQSWAKLHDTWPA
jgi:ATP adenylyltransferase